MGREGCRQQEHAQLTFELAEVLQPASQVQSNKQYAPLKEKLSPGKWFKRRGITIAGLSAIRCRDDWKEVIVRSSSVARQQLADLANPKGPGTCDHNTAERALNIVTSLPFFALGWQAYRQGRSDESRVYGASIMGVGVGAVAFHASSGKLRSWGRKLDYWVISLSTAALSRALFPDMSAHKTAASALLTPMQPLAVTTLNAASMEVEFWKQARVNPQLRQAHRLHVASGALGAACFVLEDFKPTLPLIHTMWHCLSAVALHTTNNLVADADRRRFESASA